MSMRAALLACIATAALAGCAAGPPATSAAAAASPASLEGTSWRLVQISMGDGAIRPAIDRSRYTVGFGTAGVLNLRFDCNRGRGSWTSSGPGNLEFGPLSLTRAMCAPGSLHDELLRQWPHVRSYLLKDGRLYLSLMADGGTLEFEPAP
jgi:para-nitrobenzyl esterase